MALEEGKDYVCISGEKVRILGTNDKMRRFPVRYELVKILQLTDRSFEEQEEVLKEHHVMGGLTHDMNAPGGVRHQQSGKCLMLNAGGLINNPDKYERRLRSFDIPLDRS